MPSFCLQDSRETCFTYQLFVQPLFRSCCQHPQSIPCPHQVSCNTFKLLTTLMLRTTHIHKMSQPVFVFVPGAWHSPDAYDGVIAGLESHGYSSVKVKLPSVGGAPVTYDFKEDVDAIISTVTKLVEQNKEVIVVGHSYSGQPIGEIPKELSKTEREPKQLKGGVIRLVFIMAFLVPEGFQAAPRDDISTMYWFMKADTKASISILSAVKQIICCSRSNCKKHRSRSECFALHLLTGRFRPGPSTLLLKTLRRSGIMTFQTRKPIAGPRKLCPRVLAYSGASRPMRPGVISLRHTFYATTIDRLPNPSPRCLFRGQRSLETTCWTRLKNAKAPGIL